MSAFGLSECGLRLIFRLDQCCVLEPRLQNNSLCPLKKEVEGVIFFCGFMELYTVVCLQGRCDARWLCSYAADGEAHNCGCCHRDAPARGLESQEAASIPPPASVPFGLCSSLSPSSQNVDWELQSSLQEEQQEEPHERCCWEEGQRSALLLQGCARV